MGETDLLSIELNTDIAGAVAELGRERVPSFTLPANRFHVHRAKAEDKAKRRGIKKFIRPENALPVLDHLPVEDGDRTHCVLRGDFVPCDLIPTILGARGGCGHLRIATLGLSAANAEELAGLVERELVSELTLVVSHYFQQVDKATVYRAVVARLGKVARLVVSRCHAKVIAIPTRAGDHYVIEGSANLRSSDNLEQILITNDRATHDFHAGWIDELAAA